LQTSDLIYFSDDLLRSHPSSYEDSNSQQQHLQLTGLNLLDLTQAATPTSHTNVTGNINKIQNRNDVIDIVVQQQDESQKNSKSSPEVENDKKPISSLSGERTHGFTNASGSPVVNGKDGEGSTPINITSILAQMRRINQEQTIRNEELFGPVTNETLVIVIQVHNRLQYLRHLIVSLSQVFILFSLWKLSY
jgi:hypothetical protein